MGARIANHNLVMSTIMFVRAPLAVEGDAALPCTQATYCPLTYSICTLIVVRANWLRVPRVEPRGRIQDRLRRRLVKSGQDSLCQSCKRGAERMWCGPSFAMQLPGTVTLPRGDDERVASPHDSSRPQAFTVVLPIIASMIRSCLSRALI